MFIDSSTVDTVRVVSQVLTTGALAAGAWLFLRDSNLQVREEERQMKHSGCSTGFAFIDLVATRRAHTLKFGLRNPERNSP